MNTTAHINDYNLEPSESSIMDMLVKLGIIYCGDQEKPSIGVSDIWGTPLKLSATRNEWFDISNRKFMFNSYHLTFDNTIPYDDFGGGHTVYPKIIVSRTDSNEVVFSCSCTLHVHPDVNECVLSGKVRESTFG